MNNNKLLNLTTIISIYYICEWLGKFLKATVNETYSNSKKISFIQKQLPGYECSYELIDQRNDRCM